MVAWENFWPPMLFLTHAYFGTIEIAAGSNEELSNKTDTIYRCIYSGQSLDDSGCVGKFTYFLLPTPCVPLVYDVFVCRYDNRGCGRSYLSQRDLDAHILYRHSKDKPLAPSLQPPGLKNPMASFQIFFQPGMVRPEFIPVRHQCTLRLQNTEMWCNNYVYMQNVFVSP